MSLCGARCYGDLSDIARGRFAELKRQGLAVASAWAIKEAARGLWTYLTRGWARRAWRRLIAWMQETELEPMCRVTMLVLVHLEGILIAIVLGRSNANAVSLHGPVQMLKKRACGCRDREHFRHVISFHFGGLDLKPRLAHAHATP